MQKVLITGAAGRIGRTLRAGLKDRCDLRLMDRKPIDEAEVDDVHVGDVADVEWMAAVCQAWMPLCIWRRSQCRGSLGIRFRSQYQGDLWRL